MTGVKLDHRRTDAQLKPLLGLAVFWHEFKPAGDNVFFFLWCRQAPVGVGIGGWPDQRGSLLGLDLQAIIFELGFAALFYRVEIAHPGDNTVGDQGVG